MCWPMKLPWFALDRHLKFVLAMTALVGTFSGTALRAADIGVDLRYGTSLHTTFGSDVELSMDFNPFFFNVDYALDMKNGSQLLASAQLHLSTMDYNIAGANKVGYYTAFGLGAGYLQNYAPNLHWYAHATFYPWAQMAAASLNTRTLNGEKFVHSSLSQFSGGYGTEFTGGTFYQYRRWPFTTAMLRMYRGRIGVLLGFLVQDFKKKVDQIATSEGDSETMRTADHFRLTALTLTFPIGIEF